MYFILSIIVVFVAGLAFVSTRALVAIREGRRRRVLGIRLAAAARRAEEAHRHRPAAAAADSGALTALMPAIRQAEDGPRRVA